MSHCILDARQLARHLGVHKKTVLKWGRDGVIPRCVIGPQTIRFKWADVLDALDGYVEHRPEPSE